MSSSSVTDEKESKYVQSDAKLLGENLGQLLFWKCEKATTKMRDKQKLPTSFGNKFEIWPSRSTNGKLAETNLKGI